jgi:NADPH2:quinone reductase
MLSGGSMQQYVICDPMTLLPLPDDISFQVGSMHVVNPVTAIGLVDTIKIKGAKAAVQTAASSQLGRMIIKLCKD